jgi:hypothetical protein
MDVSSACRLPVASLLWRPSADAWALTIVCRATFHVRAHELVLAEQQDPPLTRDEYEGEGELRSLRMASDLVPMKSRLDVVLVGSAHAPGGRPVRALSARLSVGELDKVVDVVDDASHGGDAEAEHGGFAAMPLVYERTLASPSVNPVGVSADGTSGRAGPTPNLYLTHSALAGPEAPAAAAFGPLAPSWPWRRRKLGPLARATDAIDWAGQPLPQDLAPDAFQIAPPDQQLERLPERARLVLENLDRHAPLVDVELPTLRPWVTVERPGGFVDEATAEDLPAMRLDTIVIDTDRGTLSLVWRMQIALDRPDQPGRVIVSLDPLVGGAAAQLARARPEPAPSSPWPPASAAGLPFRRPTSGELPAPPSSQAWGPPAVPVPPRGVPQPTPASTSHAPASMPRSVPPSPRVPPPSIPPPRAVPAPPPSPPPPASVVAPPPRAPSVAPPPAWVPSSTLGSDASQIDAARSPWAARHGRSAGEGPAPQTIGQQVAVPVEPARAAPSAAEAQAARKPPPLERGEVVQLLWFDGPSMPRVRRLPQAGSVLAALERRAREPDLEDAFDEREPAEVEDRRDVFEILAKAPSTTEDKWAAALSAATLAGGRFVPSIVLVSGDLTLGFDERATLLATIGVATPLVGGDETLGRAIQDARDYLALPDLLAPASVIEGFRTRIEEAFKKLRRTLPPDYLDGHVERALVEQRRYRKREVFGAPHLCASLLSTSTARPVPTYLPEALTTKLPLGARLRVRALAELHLPEDPLETHEASLRIVALGRVAKLPQEPGPKA